MQRVLVLGGYGAFGRRIAERLARVAGIEVVVAGRSAAAAAAAATRLAAHAEARVSGIGLDAREISAASLGALRPAVLINAIGPYQVQDDYRVARAAIAAGVHYLDLADARAFVAGIAGLDAEARCAGVLVVSGASSVPAVSSAVLDAYTPRLAAVEAIETVIAPANSFDPGLGTTRSVLASLGRRLGRASDRRLYGWQGLERRRLPGLGARWVGLADAPDLDLLPQRHPGLVSVKVYAALEVSLFHLGLWGLSWLVRARLIRTPERLAGPLLGLKRRLSSLGSDRGGMAVTVAGRDGDGRPQRLTWSLVAGSGDGPTVAAIPSVLLAKRLLAGTLEQRGAMPCMGLFTLDDLLAELADLDIAAGVD